MSPKYTKKEFMENIRMLTSPFEKQQKPVVSNIVEKIKEMARRKP